MLRLFTAICLPDAVRAVLADTQRRLRCAGLYASWIPAPNLHLSLVFLGNIAEDRLQEAIDCLQIAAHGAEAFDCTLRHTGFFGAPGAPRILWAGVDAPPLLAALQDKLNSEFNRHTFETEGRPYHPHITLARIKPRHRQQGPPDLAAVLSKNPIREPAAIPVDALHLMQSNLTPTQVTYTSLLRQPLERRPAPCTPPH